MSKTRLGADHPDTLGSVVNLAFTLKGQSRDADAISLLRECVQLSHQTRRADHPNLVSYLLTLQSRAQSISGSCVSFVLTAQSMQQGCFPICASAVQG
jgi:hypothetical protein